MSIPSKIVGGGNISTAMNVLRVSFSQPLSSVPQYQMWDNSSTYPAVDAAGSTTIKEAFVGTSGNSSKPEYALVDTTSAAPSSNWLPASATGGSANPNRMKGSTNYVNSPITPAPATPPTAPSLAAAAGAGMGSGVYKYTITFVVGTTQPIGETLPGTEATVTTTGGNNQVSITNIPVGPTGTLYRNIYRTAVGGSTGTEKFVHLVADNTTTTYTDTLVDGSLGAVQPTIDTSGSIRFNITAEFASDAAVPSSSSQNILLQVQYQYTGTAPTLTYWYNDNGNSGTDSAPTWTQFTPGSNGLRLVNTGTSSGNYKFTLPASSTLNVQELWITSN